MDEDGESRMMCSWAAGAMGGQVKTLFERGSCAKEFAGT